jgi:hypothetical protein
MSNLQPSIDCFEKKHDNSAEKKREHILLTVVTS